MLPLSNEGWDSGLNTALFGSYSCTPVDISGRPQSRFCHWCGHAYARRNSTLATAAYPQSCSVCGHVTYLNPLVTSACVLRVGVESCCLAGRSNHARGAGRYQEDMSRPVRRQSRRRGVSLQKRPAYLWTGRPDCPLRIATEQSDLFRVYRPRWLLSSLPRARKRCRAAFRFRGGPLGHIGFSDRSSSLVSAADSCVRVFDRGGQILVGN